ncbi:MAG: sugar ABC transporter permease [Clostridiaceae bacterium]|nr:sugar ABC transporter permease [Clostridiaceae bacterium]
MKRTMSGNERRDTINFYIYILPWLISFFVLTLYPMVRSLWLCFTDSDFSGRGNFIGLDNFIRAFTKDPLFFKVFANTLYYVVMFVPSSLVLSFFIAWLLSQKVKMLGFFRTVFYLPYITAGVAVTIMWGWIFNSDYGLINYLLSLVGISGPKWLTDKRIAMISIVIMCLWSIGNNILIMLAGIQDIPVTYYESARIDGASTLRQIFSITIPLCTPTIYFNLVVGTIGAFQLFNQPYVLTKGGPVDSTRTVSMYLFSNAFEYGKMGYGSTIAWCLFVIIMFFTLVIQRSSKNWVFYDN